MFTTRFGREMLTLKPFFVRFLITTFIYITNWALKPRTTSWLNERLINIWCHFSTSELHYSRSSYTQLAMHSRQWWLRFDIYGVASVHLYAEYCISTKTFVREVLTNIIDKCKQCRLCTHQLWRALTNTWNSKTMEMCFQMSVHMYMSIDENNRTITLYSMTQATGVIVFLLRAILLQIFHQQNRVTETCRKTAADLCSMIPQSSHGRRRVRICSILSYILDHSQYSFLQNSLTHVVTNKNPNYECSKLYSNDDGDEEYYLLLPQMTDTSWRCRLQLWTPQPVCAQSVSDISLPVQPMLPNQIGPEPAP